MILWDEPAELPDLRQGRFAIRARKLIRLQGPARGKELFGDPHVLENPLFLVENGYITDIGPYKGHTDSSYTCLDLGKRVILPPLVNAHTHLQLSWLENQCLFKRGFSPWLADMIPRLLSLLHGSSEWNGEKRRTKLENVFAELKKSGTYFIGDVGGSIAGEIITINQLAHEAGIHIFNFCEHFGFELPAEGKIWPPRCRGEMENNPKLAKKSAPCGHALYSTSLSNLCGAKAWCLKNGRVFTMHLAESEEEERLLAHGDGPLWDIYKDKVIPDGWQAYGTRPYECAKKAGLVDANTLFVHGVHLNDDEIEDMADLGAAICLCPRSNANLAVGSAPLWKYIEKGARICLGTDGLSSCQDLNVLNDAIHLRDKMDLPIIAALRMCTVNGLDALGYKNLSQLEKGARARFSLIDSSLLN